MKRYCFFIIIVSLIFSGFFSCSRAAPRILHGYIQMVYYEGRDGVETRYSFFILGEDEDGVENLSELNIYHDREGLCWFLSSDDWVIYEEEGNTWIGSRSIAMTEEGPLPRGQYRTVLINNGGEKTERNFTYDGPEYPPYLFPSITVTDGRYTVFSQYPVNHLICYDQQGRTVETITLTVREGSIASLRLQSSVRAVALWAEDTEYQISALTEAVSVR